MRLKTLSVTMLLSAIMVISTPGQLRLKDRHPDEPASYTFNQRLSAKNALPTIKQIGQALESFQLLTERCAPKLTKEELKKIGNTESDVQSLGFYNAVIAIEGMIRKQNYQISKLEYELAQAKRASRRELNQKRLAFRQAEREFQQFWDNLQIRD